MANELSSQEVEAAQALAKAWDLFTALPVEREDDVAEFRHAIHAAQGIILKRSGRRQINGV